MQLHTNSNNNFVSLNFENGPEKIIMFKNISKIISCDHKPVDVQWPFEIEIQLKRGKLISLAAKTKDDSDNWVLMMNELLS